MRCHSVPGRGTGPPLAPRWPRCRCGQSCSAGPAATVRSRLMEGTRGAEPRARCGRQAVLRALPSGTTVWEAARAPNPPSGPALPCPALPAGACVACAPRGCSVPAASARGSGVTNPTGHRSPALRNRSGPAGATAGAVAGELLRVKKIICPRRCGDGEEKRPAALAPGPGAVRGESSGGARPVGARRERPLGARSAPAPPHREPLLLGDPRQSPAVPSRFPSPGAGQPCAEGSGIPV